MGCMETLFYRLSLLFQRTNLLFSFKTIMHINCRDGVDLLQVIFLCFMQREKNVPYERASSKITERKTFEHSHTATP